MTHDVVQADAFTSVPLHGGPAVVFDADDLPPAANCTLEEKM